MSSKKDSGFKRTKDALGRVIRSQPMEKVKFKWKRSLIMIGVGILAYVILRLFLVSGLEYGFAVWFVYEGIAGVAVIAYVITVRGNLSSTPTLYEDLPADWSDERKDEFLCLEAKRRAAGKKFLYIAVPLLLRLCLVWLVKYGGR